MKNVNLLALINLFSGIGISLSSPFFPSLNSKFILPDVILGWIFRVFVSIVSVIVSHSPGNVVFARLGVC